MTESAQTKTDVCKRVQMNLLAAFFLRAQELKNKEYLPKASIAILDMGTLNTLSLSLYLILPDIVYLILHLMCYMFHNIEYRLSSTYCVLHTAYCIVWVFEIHLRSAGGCRPASSPGTGGSARLWRGGRGLKRFCDTVPRGVGCLYYLLSNCTYQPVIGRTNLHREPMSNLVDKYSY